VAKVHSPTCWTEKPIGMLTVGMQIVKELDGLRGSCAKLTAKDPSSRGNFQGSSVCVFLVAAQGFLRWDIIWFGLSLWQLMWGSDKQKGREPLLKLFSSGLSSGHGSIDDHGHAVSRRDARSRLGDSVRDLISASVNLQPPHRLLLPGMLRAIPPPDSHLFFAYCHCYYYCSSN
jgi:hypothetical protein